MLYVGLTPNTCGGSGEAVSLESVKPDGGRELVVSEERENETVGRFTVVVGVLVFPNGEMKSGELDGVSWAWVLIPNKTSAATKSMHCLIACVPLSLPAPLSQLKRLHPCLSIAFRVRPEVGYALG